MQQAQIWYSTTAIVDFGQNELPTIKPGYALQYQATLLALAILGCSRLGHLNYVDT
jgi:hypothetical protein